jgi:gluconate 2-dehydrogenase subunit 3-like protein
VIDRVASVDAPVRQRQLLNALGQFEQEARSAHGRRWADLDDALRTGIVTRAAEMTEGLQGSFDYLRRTVTTAYLSTEAGMKEFGWTGRSAWKELPGCTHPDPAHE